MEDAAAMVGEESGSRILSKANETLSDALEDNETALYCESYCVICGDLHGIYVSRAQNYFQIASKVMYLNVISASIKIGYHLSRELLRGYFGLPDECPKVQVIQAQNDNLGIFNIRDDFEEDGALSLLAKNQQALYRKRNNCTLCRRSWGTIDDLILSDFKTRPDLCANRGGVSRLIHHTSTSLLLSKADKMIECMQGPQAVTR